LSTSNENRPFLTIGTPHYSGLTSEYVTSLINLFAFVPREEVELLHIRGTCIHHARNAIFNLAQGEYLLFVDSDMEFTAQDLDNLIGLDKDIVVGFYLQKTSIITSTAALRDGLGYRTLGPAEIPPEPCQVDAVGGGFMLIKRTVIDSYPAERFNAGPFDYIPTPLELYGAQWWGEDWCFCRRMKEIGREVWLHPGVVLGHVATMVLRPDSLQPCGGTIFNQRGEYLNSDGGVGSIIPDMETT